MDERYQVELDTTDPAVLGNMAAAADEYCAAHAVRGAGLGLGCHGGQPLGVVMCRGRG